jgi:sensor histidine kinase regulating citrate/malate metabolism
MVISVSLCIHNTPLPGLICGIILLAYLLYAEYSAKDKNNSDAMQTVNDNSLYLRTIEENYRKSRELWHDLNNHILSMRSLAENKQYDELEIYINSLSEKIAGSAFPVKSGSIVLDALIADKYHKARRADIYVEFVLIDYRNTINDKDLCVIIGNLFDNAIEENLRSTNNDGRYIKLYISPKDDTLIIQLINPLYHELTVKSGLPSTVKPDSVHHGMGLKNVRHICDKYNGELLWTSENGIFEITARMYVH